MTCLPYQCFSWPGPISAALYVALDYGEGKKGDNVTQKPRPKEALSNAVKLAKNFHAEAEKELNCQLNLLLAYERFKDSNATMLYPMNVLRNYARLQVCARYGRWCFKTKSSTISLLLVSA